MIMGSVSARHLLQRSDAQARPAPEPGGEGLGRPGPGAQPAAQGGHGAVQVRRAQIHSS